MPARPSSMVQAPYRAHGAVERQAATFPGGMEDRLVLLGLDFAEAVHAAHVVDAVHQAISLGKLGQAGADHAIARDQRREFLLAPALGAGWAHRQDDEACLRRRIPHADFGVRGKVTPKSASTPRGSLTARER